MPIIIPPQVLVRTGTLLELIQSVCGELGLQIPNQVVSSQDPQIMQLLGILNRFGKDLVRVFEWQELTYNAAIVMASGVRLYDLPADWNRQIPTTEWESGKRWPVRGPVTSRNWTAYKGSYVNAGIDTRFRIIRNRIELLDDPANGDTLSFEYISKNWVERASGLRTDAFESDDDSYVFPEELMQEGLRLRWKKAKGLTYDQADYDDVLERCIGQNKSSPQLSISQVRTGHLIGPYNVPEGNYGP